MDGVGFMSLETEIKEVVGLQLFAWGNLLQTLNVYMPNGFHKQSNTSQMLRLITTSLETC